MLAPSILPLHSVTEKLTTRLIEPLSQSQCTQSHPNTPRTVNPPLNEYITQEQLVRQCERGFIPQIVLHCMTKIYETDFFSFLIQCDPKQVSQPIVRARTVYRYQKINFLIDFQRKRRLFVTTTIAICWQNVGGQTLVHWLPFP